MVLLALSALGLTALLLHLSWLPPWWSPLAGAWLLPLLPARRLAFSVLLAHACLVLNSGQGWLQHVLPVECERLPVRVHGEVQGLVHIGRPPGREPYQGFTLQVDAITPEQCVGPRRIRLYAPGEPSLRAGDRIVAEARLRRPWGLRNPGLPSAQTRHFVEGVHALGSSSAVVVRTAASAPSLSARMDRRRDVISRRVRSAVGAQSGVFLAALLVGDRRAMTDEHWQLLRYYGLTHLLVISGMHVSLLAGVGWLLGTIPVRLLRWSGLPVVSRWAPALTAISAALSYAALAGFSLPTVRALAMLVPVLLLLPLGRRISAGTLLATALWTLLCWQPRAVLSASLWLSLGAVCLLLWAGSWQAGLGKLRQGVLAQAYMVLAMLPLGLWFFDAVGTVGGALNLVAVPLVTMLVVPLGLLGVLLDTVDSPAAGWCYSTAALPLELLWSAMRYWEPWVASRTLLSASPSAIALLLAGLAVCLLPVPTPREAGGVLRARLGRFCLLSCLSLPALMGGKGGGEADPHVLVFDVGQGTAVLVRSGQYSMLYDTGGSSPGVPSLAETVIIPYLRDQGVEALDLLVVSHLDNDHSGGLAALRDAIPVRAFWSGPEGVRGARRCRLGRGHRLGPRLTVQTLSTALPGDTDNNSSCVLKVTVNGLPLILPGDIDRHRERELVSYWGERLTAPLLLAAHHGSATSSSRLWLRTVSPQHAVFTAGYANRFGHPASSVLEAVASASISPWESGRHGALLAWPTSGGWRLEATRHEDRPFWWLRD